MAILTKKPAAAARRQVEDFIDSAPDGRATRGQDARPAPAPARRARGGRDKIFSVALSEIELERLEILAEQSGFTRGAFLRSLLTRAWGGRS